MSNLNVKIFSVIAGAALLSACGVIPTQKLEVIATPATMQVIHPRLPDKVVSPKGTHIKLLTPEVTAAMNEDPTAAYVYWAYSEKDYLANGAWISQLIAHINKLDAVIQYYRNVYTVPPAESNSGKK